MMLCSVFAVAQSHAVSGTVRDAAGNPLPGVAVMVPGTTIGTVTDIDGRYTINVTGNPTLSATFIGMQPGEINLAAGQTDVTLQDEENEMDEVIVVAYGVTTKGAYTGSAAQVDAESIEKRQVTDASQALSGVMPGVQILNDNGQPGVSSKIRIRGAGSINGSQDPLIVVDGMPFDGDLATINTADIESMTVLKDAASTSLYGARGANGILMITTKKGRQGDARSLSRLVGAATPARSATMTSSQARLSTSSLCISPSSTTTRRSMTRRLLMRSQTIKLVRKMERSAIRSIPCPMVRS